DRRASESSRRVSTTLRRVSGSRAGVDAANNRGAEADVVKAVGSQRHPPGAAASAAASHGPKGGERGSLELAEGASSRGTLGLTRDGPRRVSTWSNNSGGSSSSSSSSSGTSSAAGGRAGVRNASLPGRLSGSGSNGFSSTGIRNRNSSTGGSSGSGDATGETERSGPAARRVSAARRSVGVACKECGGEKVG
ncbi:unnamed protein product, partial [Scytosiphon promiscuus]